MRRDYGDLKVGVDRLIERIEGGAWRHGIKTDDAVTEVVKYGKLPADLSSWWGAKVRSKVGDFLKFSLYYWVQAALKNRRWNFEGKSGRVYRVRRIFCVEHGVADGEVDENGDPMRPDKRGIWLRWEDLSLMDAESIRRGYRERETDAQPDKIFITTTVRTLVGKPSDTVAGDVASDIADAM